MRYNPAPVLYRHATVMSRNATAIESGQRTVTANAPARVADACIVAVLLSHAAVESAWYP